VEHVLKHEEGGDLGTHEPERAEGDLVGSHAKVAADGVEEPDEGGLAGEVSEENRLCKLPDLRARDLLVGLQLPLVEVGDRVDGEPRDRAAKVDDLEELLAACCGVFREKRRGSGTGLRA
jgi:hypothetical protein